MAMDGNNNNQIAYMKILIKVWYEMTIIYLVIKIIS